MSTSDTNRSDFSWTAVRRMLVGRTSYLLALGAFSGLLILGTVSCADSGTRSRNRLRDLRTERTEIIDNLYEAYGGGALARAARAEAAKRNSALAQAREMVAGAVEEFDRGRFESYVEAVGEGDRPTTFSPDAQEFFSRDSVKRSARRFVEAGDEIESIERELELEARR